MERLSSIFIICLMQVLTMAASTFNLNVEVTPSGAASLNTSGGAYEEGQKVSLRASAHTGFLFQGWYEGEEKVASTLSFTYTMPARDASLQARFNYDPEAPVNPAMPDTCTYYNLTAAASPEGAASLNLYEGRYKAGASVALRANGRTGYVFDGWCDGSGAIISSSVSYNFTMPARNEQLTALYHYDPAIPANPEQMGVMYSTVLESKPTGGGSFNTGSVLMKEGDNTRLYAYTHPGFRFLRWEDEKGNMVSEKQDFYYVMPKGGGRLFGVFDFDPDPPANPGKNWWDKELGNVIVDDFSPGGLYSALKNAIAGSSSDAVGMITVAGVMNNNDFSIANNFGSCTLLDLSRVTGVTEIPSYAFDKTSLESVFIPATVEKIGTRAFENCSQLAKLTIYAMTPPVLESYVFRGISEGLVVYVPGAVVSQYQEAEGWKDFTILPITEDVRSLTVNLPSDVDPKAYAHMWLELRNTKSGQRMHYVMTDRRAYSFANIIRNTSWEVTLRNERGDVFGQIAEVEVKDEDVSVDFASLYLPQTMQLSILTLEGDDVTERVQISWIDSEDTYLGQSSTIAGLPEGMEISYQLTLPQDLAMAYVSPSETSCKVDGAANQVKCTLVPIPVVSMSGSVKDSSSGLPVSDALVTASQTFAGKYTKTVTGKTDAKGAFVLKLKEVPTSLTVSSSDYVSRSLVCDSLMSGTTDIALAEIALKPISGAVIALDFKYRNSILQGEEAEEQSWYDDYANISYTIFNKTSNKPVTQFNVQYPVIVLLEEVSDYDQLEITATSLSDRFMPVTDIVTIDEAQKGDICFNITQLGGLQATFVKNTNPAVAAQLYDSKGNLCKNGGYSNSKWSASGLKDGHYTLVTMGENPLYNAISSLGQLSQTGLVEGVDYALNEVEVRSGLISEVKIESVPKLDESKLYYTGANTSFTVNKPSIVAGNFLTLTGKIDFKSGYANQVSNVNLIVDLPEACDFVENSVMVGNSVSNYTLDGRRLSVPLITVADRVRFCIVPTLGGEYAPSAFARFDLNGETVTQPIGTANYSAKNLSISVPSTVAKTTVPVSGTAAGRSTVEIYDGNTLIGQTQSLANGQWSASCELNDPYNLSKHEIYAKVTTKEGHELRSETVECTYDMNAIRVSKVTMYHWNPEMRKTFSSEFDFLNPRTAPTKWTVYYPDKKFTYTIEFTNNDPDRISNVILYVETADGRHVPIEAQFDEQKELWCADIDMGHSSDGYYPVNVSVDFDFESEILIDRTHHDECVVAIDNSRKEMAALRSEIQALQDEAKAIEQEYEKTKDLINTEISMLGSESDLSKDKTLLSNIYKLLDWEYDEANLSVSAEVDDSQEFIDSLIKGVNEILDESYEDPKDAEEECHQTIEEFNAFLKQMDEEREVDTASLDNYDDRNFLIETTLGTYDYREVKASEVDLSNWPEESMTVLSMTDGSEVIFLYDEENMTILDKTADKAWILSLQSTRFGGTRMTADDVVTKLKETVLSLNGAKTVISNMLTTWAAGFEKEIKQLTEYAANLEGKLMDQLAESAVTQQKIERLERHLQEMGKQVKNGTSANYMGEVVDLNDKIKQLQVKRNILLNKAEYLKNNISRYEASITGAKAKLAVLIGVLGEIMDYWDIVKGIIKLIDIAQYGIRDMNAWSSLIGYILPCKDDDAAARILLSQAQDYRSTWGWRYVGAGALSLVSTGLSGYLAFNKAAKFLMKTVGALVADFILNTADGLFKETKTNSSNTFNEIKQNRAKLKCSKNCDEDGMPACPKPPTYDDGGKNNGDGGNGGSSKSGNPPDDVSIDPSGFVYEAVTSNRVEGVVATIFYKEMVEDMYGDLHENIVKWDAEEYAQENPLFTDDEGNYRWDVPQGLWQVRFEKEGYETTFSEWLPVPPPQLEVNIPIKQNIQPTVKSARAFEDAVELEFDKYMHPVTLTSENIIVLIDDKPLAGSVVLLNQEESYENSGESYASKVRFNAAEPFSAKEVTLLVKNRVKSYADVRMQNDYMQKFAVELEVRKIECDSVVDVAYGGSKVMKVAVLPGVAAAGKKLNVTVASALTISTDKESIELDENGCAEIIISGDLPGVGALQFSLEGYDIYAFTLVNVKKDYNKVATPTVNIASGSTVDKGTEVYLACDTEGAVIYYTLDGSCPCDDTDSRMMYDGSPIIVNDDVTIKAMAYAPDMYESEIASFVYYAADSSVGTIELDHTVRLSPLPMRESITISVADGMLKRVAFTNISGATVIYDLDSLSEANVDVSHLPAGIYIITIETNKGNTVRKVIKLD